MAGSIKDFISSFSTDVARPSRFDVTIPIPLALATFISNARQLNMRCESAELPGRTFETLQKKIGTAPVEKFPYHTMYNDVNMTFIVSDDMSEKLFFDAWMELINPSTDFNFQYKANYAVDISVNQYDVTNEMTYSAVLRDAFPIAVNQLDVDWTTEGHHKLTVVFAYTQWQNNTISAFTQGIKTGLLTGLLNNITSS